MKYHFKVGRGKTIILNDTDTFTDLGFAILKKYRIWPDHLFMFEFENGEATNSATPLGPFNDYREVSIEAKLKSRHLVIGEVMTLIYDYSSDWTRNVTLVEISSDKEDRTKKSKKTEEPHSMTKEELTQIRETLSLTKKEFAEKIGVKPMLLGRYESGGCKIPENVADVAKSLLTPPEEDASDLIKQIRESLSLSKSALAKLVGVSGTAIGNYESGKSKPKDEILSKIKELVKEKEAAPVTQTDEKVETAPEKEESAPVDEKEDAATAEEIMAAPIEEEKKLTSIVIESKMGSKITTEEILSRLPDGCDTVYVKPEENAAYWVKGNESGVINLW